MVLSALLGMQYALSLVILCLCSIFLLAMDFGVYRSLQSADKTVGIHVLHVLETIQNQTAETTDNVPANSCNNHSFSVIIVTHNEPLLFKTYACLYESFQSVQSVLENTDPSDLFEVRLLILFNHRSSYWTMLRVNLSPSSTHIPKSVSFVPVCIAFPSQLQRLVRD